MTYEKELVVADESIHETSSTEHSVTTEPESRKLPEEKRAGFWIRLVAYIIDVIVISSINTLLLSPALLLYGEETLQIGFWTINGLLALLIYYLYFALMTKLFQQTLGKMILGIKVMQMEEESLSWRDVFYREVVGRILHNVFFLLKLMYLSIAFSDEKRGVHDMIGNTKVVYV